MLLIPQSCVFTCLFKIDIRGLAIAAKTCAHTIEHVGVRMCLFGKHT